MCREKITTELLLKNGFIEPEYSKSMTKKERLYNSITGNYHVYTYETKDDYPIYIDMITGISNFNTEWYMHLDNSDHQTIGSCDIDYVDQFNKMMEIFNSVYNLK